MGSPISVRPVESGDQDDWRRLWAGYNAFYERHVPEEVTRATWGRLLDPAEPMHAVVAERERGLVGISNYLFHRSTSSLAPACYLQDLYVDAAARGAGAGRALIDAVGLAAGAAGSAQVYWLTHETNVGARSLYDSVARRSGFIHYMRASAGDARS